MRVATWNVNGMRAAVRKGFAGHVERVGPDVLLLQEVRARPEQLPPEWREPPGWTALWHPAERPGYSGTAVLARAGLKDEARGAGEPDTEGRVIVSRIEGVRLVSVYLPSGSSGDHRQAEKDRWLGFFLDWSRSLSRSRIPTILGGDFNIAHTERDIFYAKSNEKTSGFLPHERAWFGDFLKTGWTDLIREKHGDVDGPYSWWSNRGQARKLDRGWRIDYLLANKAAAKLVTDCHIDRQSGLEVSDHAMVVADLDL
ncbi:MAG: exodeoxyribonuclease III [Phycisphaerales bacterium]|nr:exodeoxyribonuclease III [Phycisphaerales bacterium]